MRPASLDWRWARMNMTTEMEAQLLEQYTPLLRKLVHRFCVYTNTRDDLKEDLFQEACLAFVEHLRSMPSIEHAARCRTQVRRAMHNYLEEMAPVRIPHYCFYDQRRHVKVISADAEPCLLLPVCDGTDPCERVALRDFLSGLEPSEARLIQLRASGYSKRAAMTALGYSSEWQVARRLKHIQRAYLQYAGTGGRSR